MDFKTFRIKTQTAEEIAAARAASDRANADRAFAGRKLVTLAVKTACVLAHDPVCRRIQAETDRGIITLQFDEARDPDGIAALETAFETAWRLACEVADEAGAPLPDAEAFTWGRFEVTGMWKPRKWFDSTGREHTAWTLVVAAWSAEVGPLTVTGGWRPHP